MLTTPCHYIVNNTQHLLMLLPITLLQDLYLWNTEGSVGVWGEKLNIWCFVRINEKIQEELGDIRNVGMSLVLVPDTGVVFSATGVNKTLTAIWEFMAPQKFLMKCCCWQTHHALLIALPTPFHRTKSCPRWESFFFYKSNIFSLQSRITQKWCM